MKISMVRHSITYDVVEANRVVEAEEDVEANVPVVRKVHGTALQYFRCALLLAKYIASSVVTHPRGNMQVSSSSEDI